LVEPADGLADLVTTEYPKVWLSDLTLAPATRSQLERVLHEQRQRDLLESHGFAPLHRLLLTGPAGTGKSMTASALATELSVPLVTIRIDALTSKYTGETSSKLRVVFDAMTHSPTVYLFDDFFDEFGAIGAWPMAGSDVVDARRILTMFLSFLGNYQPESLIVAVTDHRSLLDDALLRRFDTDIPYTLPDSTQALDLLRRRLDAVDTSAVSWEEVGNHVKGLSQAGLVRAAESTAKRAILSGSDSVSTCALITSLSELRRIHHVTGFSIGGFTRLARILRICELIYNPCSVNSKMILIDELRSWECCC
jgi:SpoVK/Ycf46/Vps4 family AAA+-type ATPase